jgi:hypothetical protein
LVHSRQYSQTPWQEWSRSQDHIQPKDASPKRPLLPFFRGTGRLRPIPLRRRKPSVLKVPIRAWFKHGWRASVRARSGSDGPAGRRMRVRLGPVIHSSRFMPQLVAQTFLSVCLEIHRQECLCHQSQLILGFLFFVFRSWSKVTCPSTKNEKPRATSAFDVTPKALRVKSLLAAR